MEIGIMPYDISQKYGVWFSRKVVYTSSWIGWFASVYKDKIILNINYSSDQGEFTSNLSSFKNKIISIDNKLIPYMICIQNEADLHLENFSGYLAELSAGASLMPVLNSGITQQNLGYFYYSMTNDLEFFKNNIIQKDAYIDRVFDANIYCIRRELELIKLNPNIPFVNVHYYLGYSTQAAGLIRMFKWVSANYKQVTCNEAGMYRSGLLTDVVDIAKQCEMPHLILYSGVGVDGSGKAIPISKELYLTVSVQ